MGFADRPDDPDSSRRCCDLRERNSVLNPFSLEPLSPELISKACLFGAATFFGNKIVFLLLSWCFAMSLDPREAASPAFTDEKGTESDSLWSMDRFKLSLVLFKVSIAALDAAQVVRYAREGRCNNRYRGEYSVWHGLGVCYVNVRIVLSSFVQ